MTGISLLGFGCMRFPLVAGKIDEKEAEKMLDAAYAGGVNYFDTAWIYHDGKSEAFTGRVLSKYPRDSWYVADKLPCWQVKKSEDVRGIFEEQLQRLGTGYIDFYLLHALNRGSWAKMEELGAWDICRQLQEEGKIRYLGFSFHDEYAAFDTIIRAKPWDFCQIQYNYMDVEEQAGRKGYELAESLGIPVIIMEPVKGGSLAGLPASVMAPLEELDPVATQVSWAFRWLAAHEGIKCILSGMSTMEQVHQNIELFSDIQPLSAQELVALDEVIKRLESRVKSPCTGCSYCMPCPHGVDIPRNFKQWNYWGMFENAGDARWQWHNAEFASARADKCTSCGACVSHCPQHIPIPQDLERMTAEMNAIKRVSGKKK